MNKNKLIAVSMLAAAMLAACGGDGGQSREALLKSAGVTTDAPAATPTPQPTTPATVQQAQQVITQMATVVVPVEVTRIIQVEVTPPPVINGFVDAGACDPYQPQPTVALDDADRAAGVVQRGQWCIDSFNKAVRP